jgi:Rieske Fe-S protein
MIGAPMEPDTFSRDTTVNDDPDEPAPCETCRLSQPRREFLRQAGLAVTGALVMVGIPPELAATMRPAAISPRRRIGSDPTYPIPAQDGVQIDKENQVILVRWKNAVYAFNLSCPHQNTALHWNDGDAEFQCPKHHSKYQPDGTFISGRATRNMDRFTLSRAGNEVQVHVGQMHKSDADQSGWSASVLELGGGE